MKELRRSGPRSRFPLEAGPIRTGGSAALLGRVDPSNAAKLGLRTVIPYLHGAGENVVRHSGGARQRL